MMAIIYKEGIEESITLNEAVEAVRFFSGKHVDKKYVSDFLKKIKEQKTLD